MVGREDEMSSLKKTIKQIHRDVLSAKHQRLFDAAKEKQVAFADHQDIESVLNTMRQKSHSSYPQKETLTRALIDEYQKLRHSFWSSVLLVAYCPMLSWFRCIF